MVLANFAWLMPVSWLVTLLLAVSVLGLFWWHIFIKTVRRFNSEDEAGD